MRRASSLPRHRSRWQTSGRFLIIAVAIFVVVVVIFGRGLARFYVDLLWHQGLGQTSVFWTALRAKLTLFAGFFVAFAVMIGANLAVADRLAPTRFPANVHPYVERFHEVFGRRLRLYRYVVAGLLALALAAPTTGQWQEWLLFRHRQSFGSADGQFGVDVGFYVFELPFLSFLLDWLFIATIVVLFVTVITHLLNGGVVFASPVPTVSQGTRGHVAVLLAVLAALKAADYWVQRYETTNERRGFVQGATYAVVHAQLPALLLLMVVAVVTSGLYLSTLRTQSFRLPLVASAVWLVLAVLADYAYPAVVQSLVVKPNQASREAPFIERNVNATRAAMGINDVATVDVDFTRLESTDVEGDLQPLRDVRLLNPVEMLSRFQIDQGIDAGLVIDDLDVDRYDLDGADGPERVEQVLLGARELDVNQSANRSWQGQHLINTRGCGVVMAPAGRVQANGQPIYQDAELDRPELYFSPTLEGYAVAGTDVQPSGCGNNASYAGTAGVRMSSFVRRLAFGLAFMDYNLIGSGAINDDSQMLWVRNVRDRVEKLAPFLSYDGDPYPVVLDGHVYWVIDAYTSTSRYPYAEAVGDDIRLSENSGIPRDANYVRNSVKAVVDAYDGSVSMYVVDDTDPIVRAWSQVFPTLFTPASEMPDGLREHLRYPEDLFRVQTNVYSKYQLTPEDFFERDGAWSVAQAPAVVARSGALTAAVTAASATVTPVDNTRPNELATETSNDRFIPYYTMFGDDRDFVLLRPFVPFSRDDQRTQLQAYMTASSDQRTYGQLSVYRVNSATLPAGPLTIANSAVATPDISELITLQSQGGATVRFGDLQLVPIQRQGDDAGEGLLYVRPLYLTVTRNSSTTPTESTYRYVVVSTDDGTAVYAPTIGGALGQLFPDLVVDLDERAGVDAADVVPGLPGGVGPTTGTGGPDDTTTAANTPAQLLTAADRLLREAKDELQVNGSLGSYQTKVEQAAALVTQALALMGVATTSDTLAPLTPTASAPTASAPTATAP